MSLFVANTREPTPPFYAEFGKYNDLTELLEAEYGAANQKLP
jgi:hypothetical protein